MKKNILLYGLLLGISVTLLKLIEYKFLIRDHSMEIYAGLIALGFTGLGIWAGLKLVGRKVEVREVIVEKREIVIEEKQVIIEKEVPVPVPSFRLNEEKLLELGISKREYGVLELMAEGLSNQEIADRLFVSLNTVKTHSSRLFEKLEVNRRTQAIQKAKEWQLLP